MQCPEDVSTKTDEFSKKKKFLFGIFRKFIRFGIVACPYKGKIGVYIVTFTFTFVRLIRRENAAFQKRKRRWLILASVVWKHHFLCLKHLVLSSINQADRNRERAPPPSNMINPPGNLLKRTDWDLTTYTHLSSFLQVRNFQHHYHLWNLITPWYSHLNTVVTDTVSKSCSHNLNIYQILFHISLLLSHVKPQLQQKAQILYFW